MSKTRLNFQEAGYYYNFLFLFLLTVFSNNKTEAQTTFTNTYNNFIGQSPYANVAHDFNNDGKMDIACCNFLSGDRVTIFTGNGNGTFSVTAHYSITTNGLFMWGGDVNNDGIWDLIIGSNSPGIYILTGNSNGTFNPAVSYPCPSNPSSMCVGDFDGDSDPDVALASSFSNSIYLFLGSSTGTYSPSFTMPVPSGPSGICSADINNDGFYDIAYGDASLNIVVMHGNALASFTNVSTMTNGLQVYDLASGDVNNDGNPDLVCSNWNATNINVYMGAGNSTFSASASYTNVVGGYNLEMSDMNCDGYDDLVAVVGFATSSHFIHIRLGSATGTLSPPIMYSMNSGMNVVTAALGEFNGDSRKDLVLGNLTTGIIVALNQLNILTVTSSTNAVCIGKPVTLTATNASSVAWSGGVINGVAFTPTISGSYTVTGSAGGCTAEQVLMVSVLPLPIVTVAAVMNRTQTCQGESVNYYRSNASSIFWSLNGTQIGINPFTISPLTTSTYTLKARGIQSGCMDSTTFTHFVVDCTDLSSYQTKSPHRLYPNPTNGKIFLEVENSEHSILRVSDSQGKLVLDIEITNSYNEINLSQLLPGFYVYELIKKGLTYSRGKIILE